jgi:hypothetical protein
MQKHAKTPENAKIPGFSPHNWGYFGAIRVKITRIHPKHLGKGERGRITFPKFTACFGQMI